MNDLLFDIRSLVDERQGLANGDHHRICRLKVELLEDFNDGSSTVHFDPILKAMEVQTERLCEVENVLERISRILDDHYKKDGKREAELPPEATVDDAGTARARRIWEASQAQSQAQPSNRGRVTLTDDQVREIRDLHAADCKLNSKVALGKRFGVSPATIHNVVTYAENTRYAEIG